MCGQQIQQISEMQFDTLSNPQSFFGVENTIQKKQKTTCSDFPSDAM